MEPAKHHPAPRDLKALRSEGVLQVVWADRNNLLHRVQMFFDAMPPSCWNRVGDG